MPIFEYQCNTCARRFSALVGVVANAQPPVCPRCESVDLRKLVSRFAKLRSEDEAADALAAAADGADMDDPRAMRRLMRDMASEMGEDMDGDELEEMMEAAMEDETDGNDMGNGDGDDW